MRNFLEELYFGNLDPQARGYRKNSHILKVSENINDLEEKLTQRLNGEEKKLFLDFCNAYGELMGDTVNITVRRSRQSGVARATCPD